MLSDLPPVVTVDRLGGGVVRLTLLRRITVDEIENPVDARIGAGDEVRPCDRTLRRDTGAQRSKAACVAQFRQSWESALIHQALTQTRIHSIKPKDDQLGMAIRIAMA